MRSSSSLVFPANDRIILLILRYIKCNKWYNRLKQLDSEKRGIWKSYQR